MKALVKHTLGALGAALALSAAAQDTFTLKVHHFWPPGAMPPAKRLPITRSAPARSRST